MSANEDKLEQHLIRSQVEAIYRTLQERQLQYVNQALVLHREMNYYIQNVQFPDEALEYNTANCLGGAILFASLLSMCNLESAILLMREHALVGWKVLNEPPPLRVERLA